MRVVYKNYKTSVGKVRRKLFKKRVKNSKKSFTLLN